jgi:hypothetical protein
MKNWVYFLEREKAIKAKRCEDLSEEGYGKKSRV